MGLTFRVAHDGRLSHLCCCSPAADRDEWIAYINILDEISKSGATIPSAPVVPDPKEKLRLKDHLATLFLFCVAAHGRYSSIGTLLPPYCEALVPSSSDAPEWEEERLGNMVTIVSGKGGASFSISY
jgi:hypothetical protein